MENPWQNLIKKGEEIMAEELNTLPQAITLVNNVNTLMLAVEELEGSNKFKIIKEEVMFFKFTKPEFLSIKIYGENVVDLLARDPLMSTDQSMHDYQKVQKKISRFCRDNPELIRYCRTGQTHLDEVFFTAARWQGRPLHEHPCHRWATYLAYQRLHKWIDNRITYADKSVRPQSPLTWTAPKTALIELLYAIHATGACNNGKADVKILAESLESCFQVNLGNYYRVFQDIRQRKTKQSIFLDELKEGLMNRIHSME